MSISVEKGAQIASLALSPEEWTEFAASIRKEFNTYVKDGDEWRKNKIVFFHCYRCGEYVSMPQEKVRHAKSADDDDFVILRCPECNRDVLELGMHFEVIQGALGVPEYNCSLAIAKHYHQYLQRTESKESGEKNEKK